ncbi:MAG: hypothetical protein GF398_04010 [Chitinivibrionales bacterium]|nr:hypothetical protein [Chitinivibrionales bacterium]
MCGQPIIGRSSRDIPAGALQTHHGEILLRMKERKQWAEEFRQIPIVSSPIGATVLLGDLGDVQDGFEEEGFHSQFNLQPSVEIEIFRVGRQSPMQIAAAVKDILEDFAPTLPEGVSWRIDSNRADDYRERLALLLKNGAIGLIIVLFILALFLEYRLAFWVMMGMAISFLGGLTMLPMVDVSINMVSMFGFLVVLGIVVDDAIVVGENVYHKRQQGFSPMVAAIEGTREVAGPVTSSILTNIVAFAPLMFVPGTTGKFWWALPVVVIVILILTPGNVEVPLLDIAEVNTSEAFTSINHCDGRRIVSVGMDVEPKRAVSQVIESIKREELPRLRADFPGLTWAFEGSQAEMRESTTSLWAGFAMAMTIVFGLLAIAFGSYIQPVVIMTAIPVGIVGAVIGHILLGYDLSLISLMGIVALAGVVVNDSLIMIHYANTRRNELSPRAAVHEAALRRFRPIMLTTVTTFGGLAPVIFETSRQAYYLIPMAISLGFGILFASAINLILVPCLYTILEDIVGLVRGNLGTSRG